ncbi:helix-turn-helix transcriptional regulator [Paracidovorax avenae]|uniref:helix-turn-helix transcriptional regulator n=1 Tax=Paracidovorax avenae TaxID=80867 RepID=UPI000D21C362|nr:helix-turn-helix domain-containing protein [Paracidovorax avenae]AVS97429.1 AraC family transcriptional regulator [Paracidovorax avenae]AVT04604.1 AraC family transcriptional regulator [Paracidovorax avenae]
MTTVNDPSVHRPCSSGDRIMWLTHERIFYAGLLGAPVMHDKGAITVYVAIEGRLRVRFQGGEWHAAEVVVVQPYVPHEIASEGRHVIDLLIEPETVDASRLPPWLRACGAVHVPGFAAHVRATHQRLAAGVGTQPLQPADFDAVFFGQPLPGRMLDMRIAGVFDGLRSDPSTMDAAEQCAAQAGLSFSRFLHLFKEQAGAPFRSVRTWKRARALLQHVNSDSNLVYVALNIGYPDSTHFSHSIRRTYGLKPRDIFAGSRKLRVIAQPVMHPSLAAG